MNDRSLAVAMVWMLGFGTLVGAAPQPVAGAGNVSVGNQASVPIGSDGEVFAGQSVFNNSAAGNEPLGIQVSSTGDTKATVTANKSGYWSFDTGTVPADQYDVVNSDGTHLLTFTTTDLGVDVRSGILIHTYGGPDSFAESPGPYREVIVEMDTINRDAVVQSPDINVSKYSPDTTLERDRVVATVGSDGEATVRISEAVLDGNTTTIKGFDRATLINDTATIQSPNDSPYNYEVLQAPDTVVTDGDTVYTQQNLVYNAGDPDATYDIDSDSGSGTATRGANDTGWVPVPVYGTDSQNITLTERDSGSDTASFSYREQTLTLTAGDTSLDKAGDTTGSVNVSSNKPTYRVFVYSPNLTRTEVATLVPAVEGSSGHAEISGLSGTTELTLNASGVPTGDYRLHVTDPYSTLNDSIVVSVTDSSTSGGGSSITYASTSSTETASPTSTPTATPTATPTPTPTLSPTETPTSGPTATSTESVTATPPTTPVTRTSTEGGDITTTDQGVDESEDTAVSTPASASGPGLGPAVAAVAAIAAVVLAARRQQS